jgi:hypothetical protein
VFRSGSVATKRCLAAELIEEGSLPGLHGSHPFRPNDVDLGMLDGRSLLDNEAIVSTLVDVCGLKFSQASRTTTFLQATIKRSSSSLQARHSCGAARNQQLLADSPSESKLSAHRFAQLLQALVRDLSSPLNRVRREEHHPEG